MCIKQVDFGIVYRMCKYGKSTITIIYKITNWFIALVIIDWLVMLARSFLNHFEMSNPNRVPNKNKKKECNSKIYVF